MERKTYRQSERDIKMVRGTEDKDREIAKAANIAARRKWGGGQKKEEEWGRVEGNVRQAAAEDSSVPVEEIKGLHPVWLMS